MPDFFSPWQAVAQPSEPEREDCHGVIGVADEAGQSVLKYSLIRGATFAGFFSPWQAVAQPSEPEREDCHGVIGVADEAGQSVLNTGMPSACHAVDFLQRKKGCCARLIGSERNAFLPVAVRPAT